MNNKHSYICIVRDAMREVFRSTWYVALALVTSAIIFAVAVLLPNVGLIAQVIGDANIPLASKIQVPISFLGSIFTNFSVLSASYTVAIAVLFGINLAMIVYYIRKRKSMMNSAGVATSFGGFMSGTLGIGCAACGSFILSALGASGAVALLPIRGAEFGILSVGLLAASIFSISKKVSAPGVCNPQSS